MYDSGISKLKSSSCWPMKCHGIKGIFKYSDIYCFGTVEILKYEYIFLFLTFVRQVHVYSKQLLVCLGPSYAFTFLILLHGFWSFHTAMVSLASPAKLGSG